jgi:hypothetical protein
VRKAAAILAGQHGRTQGAVTSFTLVLKLTPSQSGAVRNFGGLIMSNALTSYLTESIAKAARTRTSWNDRLAHWERPASDSEEARIERAAGMVRSTLAGSAWWKSEGITIQPQGSYHNNTNVRQEADMDLRAMHPLMKVEYDKATGIVYRGPMLNDLAQAMRVEMVKSLWSAFGKDNVGIGNKAIRIHKLPGSRADVDIVPAFTYRWILWNQPGMNYVYVDGVAILGIDGSWTYNFPEHHHVNGIAKRERTRHRFKKQVRSLKTLRDELVQLKHIQPKQVPSFLVECLTFAVEDPYFLVEGDDRYDRIKRVVGRMQELIANPLWTSTAMEISGFKALFGSSQAWNLAGAKAFVDAALTRLSA